MSQRSWLGPAIVFVLALAVYGSTMPPGLTWAHSGADGGDLVTAALVGGVPHPSGYPTYILLARLFSRLPWHTPAWRITLVSVFGGAAASALVAATVQSLITWKRSLGGPHPATDYLGAKGTEAPAMSWPSSIVASALFVAPGILAGLMLAFSPLLWGQATVAEVYAVQACLSAVMIWTLVRWRVSSNPNWAIAAGVAFGLGLGNHLTSIWLVPLAGACLIIPSTPQGGRGRAVVSFALGTAAGLLVYVYLPVAAMANPPVNWGNPQTLAGFWWVLSGKLYRPLIFAVSGLEALGRLSAWSGLLWREFLPWGVALALAGLFWLWQVDRTFALGMLASLALGLIWAIGYDTTDSVLTLLPGWVMIGLWIGLGMSWLITWLRRFDDRVALAAVLVSLGMLALPFYWNWTANDLSKDHVAEDYLNDLLQAVQPEALVVTVGDRATFALWYARYGLKRRPDIIPVSRDLWSLESYRHTLGVTHPTLAGQQLPFELESLLLAALQQHRPVYIIQVNEEPAASAEPALPLGSMSRLRPIVLSSSSEMRGWTLWKLEPLR